MYGTSDSAVSRGNGMDSLVWEKNSIRRAPGIKFSNASTSSLKHCCD